MTTWMLLAVFGFVLVGVTLEQLVARCERPEFGHPDVEASEPSGREPISAEVIYVDLGFTYWCLVQPVEGGFVQPGPLDAANSEVGRHGTRIARPAGEEER